MSSNESKARAKIEEAEKKLKKSGGFLSFLGGGTNFTDAAELYIQVPRGNMYLV
jgi:hypothetical protein